MTIEWPSHWDSEEGWPVKEKAPLTAKEPRLWGSLGSALRFQKVRLRDRIQGLGGPAGYSLDRSLESCDHEIRTYFEAHGKRPSAKRCLVFNRTDAWLRDQGSSLAQRCDELGLPALLDAQRGLESCDREILAYFAKAFRRPSARAKEFRKLDAWLRLRNTSLAKRCDELGLPTLRTDDRSLESCDREILAYFEKEGRYPTQGTSREFRRIDEWLRARDSSLPRRCVELENQVHSEPRRNVA